MDALATWTHKTKGRRASAAALHSIGADQTFRFSADSLPRLATIS